MTRFIDTPAAAAWIATGPDRETARAVMRGIAALTADEAEAEAAWADGYTADLDADDLSAALLRWIAQHEPAALSDADVCWGQDGRDWLGDCESNIVIAEINAAGEAALTAWLEEHLDEPGYAGAFAADMIAKGDFSDALLVVPQVELGAFHARDRSPRVYWFGAGEYDLVLRNEDGDEIARWGVR